MTSPSEERDELMAWVSLSLSPCNRKNCGELHAQHAAHDQDVVLLVVKKLTVAPDSLSRSDPARSTRFSCPLTVWPLNEFWPRIARENTECDREERSLHCARESVP